MSIYGNPVMLGGGGGGSTAEWRDNFLCNWDFANPVNTNGQTQYRSSTRIISLDGWRLQNGQLDIVSGGIKLSQYTSGSAGFFMQHFSTSATTAFATYNSPMICTAIIDGTVASFDPQLTSGSGSKGGTWISGVSVRFFNYGTEVAFTIDINDDTGDHLIQVVKLETGSSQTLATVSGGSFALNNVMDPQTEKIKIKEGWVYNT